MKNKNLKNFSRNAKKIIEKHYANIYPGYVVTTTWDNLERTNPSKADELASEIEIELDKRYDVNLELISKKDAINQIEAITTSTGLMNPAPYLIKGCSNIYDVIREGDLIYFGRKINKSNYVKTWDRIIIIVLFKFNKIISFMLTPGHWTMSGEDYIYGNCNFETINLDQLIKFNITTDDEYLNNTKLIDRDSYIKLAHKFCKDVFNRNLVSGTDIDDDLLNDIKKNYHKYYLRLKKDYPELIKFWSEPRTKGEPGVEFILFILLYELNDGNGLNEQEVVVKDNLIKLCDYNTILDPYLLEMAIYHLIFYGGDNFNTYKEFAKLTGDTKIMKQISDSINHGGYKDLIDELYGYDLIEDDIIYNTEDPNLSKDEFIKIMNLSKVDKLFPKFVNSLYEDYNSIDENRFDYWNSGY